MSSALQIEPCGHLRNRIRARLVSLSFLAISLMLISESRLSAQQDNPVDFATQIAPIFEKHCVDCHGESAPEGGLRLTHRKGAFTEADSGKKAIVAFHPERSELIARTHSTDEDEQMPPGSSLSKKEKQLLSQWIKEGAKWPESDPRSGHWAYAVPRKPVRPNVKRVSWPQNDLDYFILNRMEKAGWTPSQRATPEQLIRRVYFALTGLPPSIEAIQKFRKDPSRKAYEAIVDDLLASPRFGEHFAQGWLDLARYADSNGFQADQLRDSWAYRDWVINAINKDQPFDQFAIEQLAGDLIPNATLDQKIATGFHRAAACNVEAGVHPEQNRINQVFDRVNTTGTVFLGTTIECAQCHNHKYDPISQDEYYQLFAFFNNTPIEVKLQSGVQYNFYGPKMDLPLPVEKVALRKRILDEISRLEDQLAKLRKQTEGGQKEWEAQILASLDRPIKWQTLELEGFDSNGGESHEILEDHSILISGSLPGTSIYTVQTKSLQQKITGLKLEVLTHESIPGKGPGRGDEVRTNFILSEFSVSRLQGQRWKAITIRSPHADFSQQGWPVKNSIDGNRKTGWAIAPEFGKNHWAVYPFAKPLKLDGALKLTLDQNYGRGRTIGRFRVLATKDHLANANVPKPIRQILLAKKRKSGQRKRLREYYESTKPEIVQLVQKLEQARKRLSQLSPDSTLVMQEMDQPRTTKKLIRGDYLSPGKKVEPGVPSILNSYPNQLPKNRLGFAKWLMSGENPLTARVAVNRWWNHFFGRGIVSSLEDFGIQSESPTHPQLLDYLATELVLSNWSRKKIFRQIVLSATFCQSSNLQEKHLQLDRNNRWYSRGPRRRMSAEMIRENGLAVSGLLHHQIGGKPVMPYQPDQIWRAVGRNAPKWQEATDEQRFRRGVYVVWRRAAPYPSFVNFDAPDRAACVVSRSTTNTPLQALTLLNDQSFMEMALSLAVKTMQSELENPTPAATIRKMFIRCVSRAPQPDELAILQKLYDSQLAFFENNREQAKILLSNIKYVDSPKNHLAKTAAMTIVANTLLNLDETINY